MTASPICRRLPARDPAARISTPRSGSEVAARAVQLDRVPCRGAGIAQGAPARAGAFCCGADRDSRRRVTRRGSDTLPGRSGSTRRWCGRRLSPQPSDQVIWLIMMFERWSAASARRWNAMADGCSRSCHRMWPIHAIEIVCSSVREKRVMEASEAVHWSGCWLLLLFCCAGCRYLSAVRTKRKQRQLGETGPGASVRMPPENRRP